MKKGFTLLEVMLALAITVLLTLLCVNLLNLVRQTKEIHVGINQYDVFALQLQHEIMLAYDFKMDKDELCYKKFEKDFCLQYDKERLVKTPGYEILLFEVTNGRFEINETTITLEGIHQNEVFRLHLERLKE